jgi:hypothetical protein
MPILRVSEGRLEQTAGIIRMIKSRDIGRREMRIGYGRKRPQGGRRHRWEDNIEMGQRERWGGKA